jgi:hypothetical protein
MEFNALRSTPAPNVKFTFPGLIVERVCFICDPSDRWYFKNVDSIFGAVAVCGIHMEDLQSSSVMVHHTIDRLSCALVDSCLTGCLVALDWGSELAVRISEGTPSGRQGGGRGSQPLGMFRYEKDSVVDVSVSYIPGLLCLREGPVFLGCLREFRTACPGMTLGALLMRMISGTRADSVSVVLLDWIGVFRRWMCQRHSLTLDRDTTVGM